MPSNIPLWTFGVAFRLRLVTFTEQAPPSYRPLSGIPAWRDSHQSHVAPSRDIHRACPPCLQASQRQIALLDEGIWTSLSKRICLHLAGTAFGLLGVLLEGPFGNRHRFPHQEPSHNLSPSVLRKIFGRSLARGPSPQVLQRHPRVAKGTYIGTLARGPCLQIPRWHPRVAKHSSDRSSARRPCP